MKALQKGTKGDGGVGVASLEVTTGVKKTFTLSKKRSEELREKPTATKKVKAGIISVPCLGRK